MIRIRLTRSPSWLFRSSLLFLALAWILCSPSVRLSHGEDDVKIWEFSPYAVEVWYTFAPELHVGNAARQKFLQDLEFELDRTFRATWRTQLAELAPEWAGLARRRFEDFTVQDLMFNELTLVVALKREDTKTVRTLEAAVENLDSIAVTEAGLRQIQLAASRFSIPEASLAAKLLAKCTTSSDSLDQMKSKLVANELAAALIPKNEARKISDGVRTILTPVPWHTNSILKRKDKIMFLHVSMDGDQYQVKARELDCPMQFMGPTFQASTPRWTHAARNAAHCIVRAFAPIARVEEAESTSATLLHRAGGLIVNPNNPSRIRVGDVLQPIVRRDDKNGIPTLLQPISWTFAAITKSDNVKLQANVYTYSNGPGLQGRRNRRTQRMVLRVRPIVDETQIEVLVRGSGKPQSGCFVFQRDMLTDEWTELGRTDWRGRFTVPVPENGRFLEASVKYARRMAKREAELAAEAAEASQSTNEASEQDTAPETKAEITADLSEPLTDDPEAIALNFPLIQIYIKNGNTVLAKLPMVPGLSRVETAELNDDARRLQAEAFVNGFSGEIVSVIGLRNILAARIKMNLEDKDLEEAALNLAKMREIPTYTQLSDELDRIQRVMFDEKGGKVSVGEKRKMDRMFENVSDLLQKYLQDSLFQESLEAVQNAGGETVGVKSADESRADEDSL